PSGHRPGTTVVPVAVPLFAAVARGWRVHEPGPLGPLRAGRRPLLRRARVTRPLADRALLLLHPRLARAPVSLRHSSPTVAAAACRGLDFPELARAGRVGARAAALRRAHRRRRLAACARATTVCVSWSSVLPRRLSWKA